MKYINTKTGVIIDTPCLISGGDWIEYVREHPAEEIIEEVEVEIKEEVEEVKEEPEEEGIDGITIKQIKQELDAFGIEYNPRAKKQELYELMMQGR